MDVINWQLIRHPMNWLIVFLMVFIAMIAVHLILSGFSGDLSAYPAQPNNPNPPSPIFDNGTPGSNVQNF